MTMAPADLIWQTTTTSGTGPFSLSGPLAGYRGYSIYSNGSIAPYFRSDSSGNFEDGEATVSTTTGITTLTSVAVHYSSNSNAPMNWAAGGKQNVRLAYAAGQAILRRNNGAEWSPVGDLFCANVGAATDGVRNLSGGSDGRIVRYGSSGLVANAQNTDTVDQLSNVFFRLNGKYYRPGDLVPWTSGQTAGSTLWLGENTTPFLTAPPAPSATVRQKRLGKVISSSAFHFNPSVANSLTALLPTSTGGANSTIVRWSGSGTLVAASRHDTPTQLTFLYARGSDGVPYPPGSLVPFAGVAANTVYFLDTAGALYTTAVTPDAGLPNTQVLIGFGWDTGVLLFEPQRPIGGNLGSGVALKLEAGMLVV